MVMLCFKVMLCLLRWWCVGGYGGVVVVVILWFIVVDYSEIIRNINTDYLQERTA